MKDWNVVVTIYQDGFTRVFRALQELGPVARTPYHNVLVMKVGDPIGLLEAIERRTEESPALYDAISRVAPAMRSFDFRSAEDFEREARSILKGWCERLLGQTFHVRLHRRGAIGPLRSPDIERVFDDAILSATSREGRAARISFSDPDVVVAIDTIDDRAGIGLWTREELARHRLLRPD